MSFKVGDIVIGQNAQRELQYNGMEGEVVGPLEMRTWALSSFGVTEGETYLVKWADGSQRCTWPFQMRRRKDPPPQRQELGEWDLCPWKPALPVTVTEPNRV